MSTPTMLDARLSTHSGWLAGRSVDAAEPWALDAPAAAPLTRRERRRRAKLERREQKRAKRRGAAGPVRARPATPAPAPTPPPADHFERPLIGLAQDDGFSGNCQRYPLCATISRAFAPPTPTPRQPKAPSAAARLLEGQRLLGELFDDDPAEALKRRRRADNPLWALAQGPDAEKAKSCRRMREALRLACRARELGEDVPLGRLSATAALVLCRRALTDEDARALALRATMEGWSARKLRTESYRLAPKRERRPAEDESSPE